MAELKAITARPDPEVVEVLENLLAEAKAGIIQSVIYCGTRSDGCVIHGWKVNGGAVAADGALFRLVFDYMGNQD